MLKFYTIKPCYTNFFEQGLKTASAIENHVMENRVKRGITVISSMQDSGYVQKQDKERQKNSLLIFILQT